MTEQNTQAATLPELRRAEFLTSARRLAEDRYLDRWLAMYSGRGIYASWILFTGAGEHPSLWEFYKRARKEGIHVYLRRHFSTNFYKELGRLGIHDKDIQELLSAREMESN